AAFVLYWASSLCLALFVLRSPDKECKTIIKRSMQDNSGAEAPHSKSQNRPRPARLYNGRRIARTGRTTMNPRPVLPSPPRLGAAPDADPSDARLLRRFVRERDESAFELLVWRHGAMVYGLCRRLLRDHHDAEDAFQATLLVLARKAGSIGKRESVGSWLYK